MSDSTRSIWSTSSTAQTAATARGENFVTTALEGDTVTAAPRGGMPAANLSMVKRRANVKHPVRNQTHTLESWTRTVGDEDRVFLPPTPQQAERCMSLPALLR